MTDNVLQIPLPCGRFALADKEDFPLLSSRSWRAQINGPNAIYAVYSQYRKHLGLNALTVGMHRVVMNAPRDQIIDHINGDGLDNRRRNLRIVSSLQNMQNRMKHTVGQSTYKGIRPLKGRWEARITYGGRRKSIGWFDTEIQAAQAYDTAARSIFGEFCCLNFALPHERSALSTQRQSAQDAMADYHKAKQMRG
jgi:hypothetical protein